MSVLISKMYWLYSRENRVLFYKDETDEIMIST